MGYKSFTEYNVSEVVVWINAIGMTDRAADFEENAVDGKLLVELTDEDLRSDLGFSGLQAKKFRQKLAFALELTAGGTGNGGGDDGAARIAELEAENTALQNQLNELNAIKRALYPDPAPVYAAAPAPAPPSHHQNKGPGVVGGAAFGAAGGAAKGAIAGAILPGMSARDGAKAGAAVGGATGGARALLRNRR